jgi:deazaflavin-dependent oxidoreductase (nitroreductase family)
MTANHYRKPGWFTKHVFNNIVKALTRLGVSVWGSRIIEVRGRKSGEPHRTAVNLLELDGTEYLVAPRGITQWVRNLRAADGDLAVIIGRRREDRTATELTGAQAVPVLRAYLKKWKAEVGVFFDGVGPGASDDELLAIVPKHPVFRLAAK